MYKNILKLICLRILKPCVMELAHGFFIFSVINKLNNINNWNITKILREFIS